MARTKLITFAVFCNRMVGEKVKAIDFDDLTDSRMSKRHQKFWSNIMFMDSEGRTINVTREYLQQGMTFEEAVTDWIDYATPEQLEETIHTI